VGIRYSLSSLEWNGYRIRQSKGREGKGDLVMRNGKEIDQPYPVRQDKFGFRDVLLEHEDVWQGRLDRAGSWTWIPDLDPDTKGAGKDRETGNDVGRARRTPLAFGRNDLVGVDVFRRTSTSSLLAASWPRYTLAWWTATRCPSSPETRSRRSRDSDPAIRQGVAVVPAAAVSWIWEVESNPGSPHLRLRAEKGWTSGRKHGTRTKE
jgi:hypothetical protein